MGIDRDNLGRFIETTGSSRYKRKNYKGKNSQYSRYIWEECYGAIPVGFVIHHINGDKKDDRIENLKAVSWAEHNKIHSRIPWNKGIKAPQISMARMGHLVSDEQIEKTKQTWKDKYIDSMREIYRMKILDYTWLYISEKVGVTIDAAKWRYRKYKAGYLCG